MQSVKKAIRQMSHMKKNRLTKRGDYLINFTSNSIVLTCSYKKVLYPLGVFATVGHIDAIGINLIRSSYLIIKIKTTTN